MRRTVFLALALLTGLGGVAQAVVTTVFDIQLGYQPIGTEVTVENVVVTGSGRFGFFVQETSPHPVWQWMYSGIWVHTNGAHIGSVHRGDLVNVTGAYAEYFNFSEIDAYHAPCGGTMQCHYEVVGTGTVPAPVSVRINEINTATAPYAEAYESVLVRVDRDDNTLFARALDQFNEWYLSTLATPGQGDSILVDNYSADPQGEFDYVPPDPGDPLTFLQGVLVYNYSKYKIAPRNCFEDMGVSGCPPVLRAVYAYDNTHVDVTFAVDVEQASAENEGNYYFDSGLAVVLAVRDADNHSLVRLTTGAQDPGLVDIGYVENVRSEVGLAVMPPGEYTFSQGLTPIYLIQHVANPTVDDSPYLNTTVTVDGRVTAVEGNYYFVQEGDAGPYQHLYGRVARTGDLAVGDSIRFAGVVREYYGLTEIGFTNGVQLVERLGVATQPPIVHDVTATEILYDADTGDGNPPDDNAPEPWETALLRLSQPALMDSVPGQGALYGEWNMLVLNGAHFDTCRTDVMHTINEMGATLHYRPAQHDSVVTTGILMYEYNIYRLIPRTRADLDILYSTDVPEPGIGALGVRLDPNRPNPFARETALSFRLDDHADAVSIDIFDVTGACVRHLLKEAPLAPGPHTVAWDGRGERGARQSAGTYFYRLTVDGRAEARQMIRID
jgi:hypothetical protein